MSGQSPSFDAQQAEAVAPPPPPPFQSAPLVSTVHVGASGPIGRVRPTGTCALLYVVTLGIYGLVWWYQTHEEMKRHSGQGVGGAVALIIGFFASIVNLFLTPAEVGGLYERRGQQAPVSAMTGLWGALGWIILIGPIVWFVKTNNALNEYWRSVGAQG
jgi:hypothetical protein